MITKEEALELLNLSSSSGKDEISSAYKQLYSDYQIRLTNAPTPHLKTLYQNNLKKLEDALKLLLPEGISGGIEDLPSDTPVLQTGSNTNTAKVQSGTAKTTTGNNKTGQNKQAAAEKKNSILLPIIGLVAIIAVAAAVFVIIQYGGMYNAKQKEALALIKERDELKKTVSNFTPILENGKMRVVNNFNSDISVVWWAVTYRDKNGDIKKFDSFSDGYNQNGNPMFPSYDVKIGQSVEMQYAIGNSVVWDGSVITYALIFMDSKNPSTLISFSGIWNNDAKDGKLYLSKPRYAY